MKYFFENFKLGYMGIMVYVGYVYLIGVFGLLWFLFQE